MGTWNFTSGETELIHNVPAQWSQTDHYVLINGSVYSEDSTNILGSPVPIIFKLGFEFNYNNNALTNITLQGSIETNGNGGVSFGGVGSLFSSFMIVRLRS